MEGLLTIPLGIIMFVFALLAVEVKKIINSVICLSLLSMLSVLGFVLMKALDVAVAEAVIGSGLVTVLFVFTLLGIRGEEIKEGEEKCEESLL